ncbi:protein phosphatase 2C domain-containing protein [Antiquaquibacter oligotrophicus]|uniref:protein phosphatase 2C domain-containing protein n=1 Tax=Antiquaquibacter oligotrophicus TaxID=2880260 RepID=UPI002AC9EDAC|nr:protein phosphatase 2C domain-containing protein [Antiquaquibacter oligotrophicus]UDF13527.1 protein phosphatase 2C domain-containing protein [Antiquaquibacter oligotrophicus]
MLNVSDSISDAGGAGSNEDIVGWSDNRCWVIDGATPVTPNVIDRRSDARWLVEFVDASLRNRKDEVDPALEIGAIARAVDHRLTELGFPTSSLPPACSLALVTVSRARLSVALVGDVLVYLPERDVLLKDSRFGARERAAKNVSLQDGLESKDVRESIASRRRTYIDGPGDMFVLSRNPRVADGVKVSTFALNSREKILVMSDGFARLVDTYSVFSTFLQLFSYVEERGTQDALALLREHEARNPRGTSSNFKKADDASALVAIAASQ